MSWQALGWGWVCLAPLLLQAALPAPAAALLPLPGPHLACTAALLTLRYAAACTLPPRPAPPPCLPACRCCLARELTKRYEEFWRSTLAEALAEFRKRGPRGEFVLLVEGSDGAGCGSAEEVDEASILSALRLAVALGESPSCASKSVAKRLGVSKKLCYTLSLALQEEPGA